MASETTNIFNATSNLSQKMQTLLALDALSGNGLISTAFSEEADRLGLTPKGRERIEREKDREVERFARALREQTQEMLKRLDRLEEATARVLRENEKQLEAAREELQQVRDRAYELTAPDGTVEKVYPDGDKVRTENGAEVSPDIIKADDIGKGHSTWTEFTSKNDRWKNLNAERESLLNYQKELEGTREKVSHGDFSADELNALDRKMEKNMPQSVRDDLGLAPGSEKRIEQEGVLTSPFNKVSALDSVTNMREERNDFKQPHPAISTPAPT